MSANFPLGCRDVSACLHMACAVIFLDQRLKWHNNLWSKIVDTKNSAFDKFDYAVGPISDFGSHTGWENCWGMVSCRHVIPQLEDNLLKSHPSLFQMIFQLYSTSFLWLSITFLVFMSNMYLTFTKALL